MSQKSNLINYAYDLLARRRYTKKELKHKLELRNQRHQTPLLQQDIDQIIASFESAKIIDDQEYANLYLLSQEYRPPNGLYSIKNKLKRKGISSEQFQQALHEHPLDELAIAQKLVNKVVSASAFQKLPADKQKLTLLRRLYSRGFSQSISLRLLKDFHCD